MWYFWWKKWYWARFSLSTSVSPANSHSTDCPTLIIFTFHVIERLQKGVGLVIGFIEHLQIVTTRNYSAVTNSHIQQLTIARTESPQSAVSSPVVMW
jgi:hypothetical protein